MKGGKNTKSSEANRNISEVWEERRSSGKKGIQFTGAGVVCYVKPGRTFCRCTGSSEVYGMSCEPDPQPQAWQKVKPLHGNLYFQVSFFRKKEM